MSSSKHYDFFVIGAGSGGVRAARIAAGHGAKVGIAEASKLGGTCVNLGCVPKKIMAYASDYHAHFEDAKGYGWSVGETSFDWPTLIQNKNVEIDRLNGIYQNLLDNAGVDLIRGFAKFVDANTLDVDGEIITADKILIATGGKARKPTIPGGELTSTSDDAFYWPELPKRILVIGGGYIAVEFAHILSGMGSDVTLSYRGDLFLRGFDADIRNALADEMRTQGVKLEFNCNPDRIEKRGDVFVVPDDSCGGEYDMVLSAIGRDPHTAELNLEAAGVDMDSRGNVVINDDYQTSAPNIFAVGDVCGKYGLTPVAIKEGHVLVDRLFGNKPERFVNYNNIATAVFSNPPIGSIGMGEEAAKEAGYDVECFKSHFRPMRHVLAQREEKTLMKLIVDKKTDKVLGLHVMGLDAPEIVQGFAVAMNLGATKADFDCTMPIHPTSAEELVTL